MRKRQLSDEECTIFVQKYPITRNRDMAILLNISITTVKNYAQLLGVRKCKEYLAQVKSRASKKGLEARWKK